MNLVVDEATSRRLARVRQHGTTPELEIRRILRAKGHRYTCRNRDLPGSPDLANRRHRWAVFVHGCYWHSHEGCPRATIPKRNRRFWSAKFKANRERDRRAVVALSRLGFKVIVVWECETNDPRLPRRLGRILRGR